MSMKRPTIQEILHRTMTAPLVEPQKRVKDLDHVPRGMRNRKVEPRNIWHRHEIMGGKSGGDLMAENITMNNALLKRLMERA